MPLITSYDRTSNAANSIIDYGLADNILAGGPGVAMTFLWYGKPDGDSGGDIGYIWSRAGQRLNVSDVNNRMLFGHSSSTTLGPSKASATNSMSLGSNRYHLAATYNGGPNATDITLYMAANEASLAEVTTFGSTGNDGNSSADVITGNNLYLYNVSAANRDFGGDTYYLAVYDRVLSLAELQSAQTNGPLSVSGCIFLRANGAELVSGRTPVSSTGVTNVTTSLPPNVNLGDANAKIAANSSVGVTGSMALKTGVKLSASSSVAVTSTVILSTSPKIAAASQTSVTSSMALRTGVKLSASSNVGVTSSCTLDIPASGGGIDITSVQVLKGDTSSFIEFQAYTDKLLTNTPHTWIGFIKLTGLGSNGTSIPYIASRTNSRGSGARFFVYTASSPGAYRYGLTSTGGTTTPTRICRTPAGATGISYNGTVWYMFAASYSGSGVNYTNIRLFTDADSPGTFHGMVDGTSGSGNGSGTITSDAAIAFYLGNRVDKARGFAGKIGLVARIERYITTADELNTIVADGILNDPDVSFCWANGQDYGPHALTPVSTGANVSTSTSDLPPITYLGGGAGGVTLAANSTVNVTGSMSLRTGVKLAASSSVGVTSAATLNLGNPRLAADSQVSVTGSMTLKTGVKLAADSAVRVTSTLSSLVPITTIFADFPAANIDISATNLAGQYSNTITITAYVRTPEDSNWQQWMFGLNNVQGKTINVSVNKAGKEGSSNYLATMDGPWSSSVIDHDSWTRLSWSQTSSWISFSFVSTTPTVYVASVIPHSLTTVTSWINDLAATYPSLVKDDLPSRVAYNNGAFTCGVSGTGMDENGRTVSNLPMLGFRISTSPEGVHTKKRFVVYCGMHAGEWNNFNLVRGFVDEWINGANSAFLQDRMDLYVYPHMNPLGNYLGYKRFDAGPTGPAGDPNRSHNNGNSAAPIMSLWRTILTTDHGPFPTNQVIGFYDFHDGFSTSTANFYYTMSSQPNLSAINTIILGYLPGTTINDFTGVVGTAQRYWYENGPDYSFSVEVADDKQSMAEMQEAGRKWARIAKDAYDDGYLIELNPISANSTVTVTSGLSLRVDSPLPIDALPVPVVTNDFSVESRSQVEFTALPLAPTGQDFTTQFNYLVEFDSLAAVPSVYPTTEYTGAYVSADTLPLQVNAPAFSTTFAYVVELDSLASAITSPDFTVSSGMIVDVDALNLSVTYPSFTATSEGGVSFEALQLNVALQDFTVSYATAIETEALALQVTSPDFIASYATAVETEALALAVVTQDFVTSYETVVEVDSLQVEVTPLAFVASYATAVETEALALTVVTQDFSVSYATTAEFDVLNLTLTAPPFTAGQDTVVEVPALGVALSLPQFEVSSDSTVNTDTLDASGTYPDFSAESRQEVAIDSLNAALTLQMFDVYTNYAAIVDTLNIPLATADPEVFSRSTHQFETLNLAVQPQEFSVTSAEGEYFDALNLALTPHTFTVSVSTVMEIDALNVAISAPSFSVWSGTTSELDVLHIDVATAAFDVSESNSVAFSATNLNVSASDFTVSSNVIVDFGTLFVPINAPDPALKTRAEFELADVPVSTLPFVVEADSVTQFTLLSLAPNTPTFNGLSNYEVDFDALQVPVSTAEFSVSSQNKSVFSAAALSVTSPAFTASSQFVVTFDVLDGHASTHDFSVQERSLNVFTPSNLSPTLPTFISTSESTNEFSAKAIEVQTRDFVVASRSDSVNVFDALITGPVPSEFLAASNYKVTFPVHVIAPSLPDFIAKKDEDNVSLFPPASLQLTLPESVENQNFEVAFEALSTPLTFFDMYTQQKNSVLPLALNLKITPSVFGLNGVFKDSIPFEEDQVICSELPVDSVINIPFVSKDLETGLSLGDFNILTTRNNAVLSLPLSLTEAGSGLYILTFTPTMTGQYSVFIDTRVVGYFTIVAADKLSLLWDIRDEALGSWHWNKVSNKLTLLRHNGSPLAEFDMFEDANQSSRERIL